jgi:hypothetical protein
MKMLVILLAVALTACHLEKGTVRSLDLVEYGTFRKGQVQHDASAPKTITGQMHGVADAVLLERTTEIPAARGTSFGVRIKLVGTPDGVVVPCVAKCLHPTYTDPASGRTSDTEEWTNAVPIGRATYIGYTLDEDWELMPGRWTLQVSAGPDVRVEQTFTLVPANAPNQAMQRTAPRSGSALSVVNTFSLQPRALSGAVADLVSR